MSRTLQVSWRWREALVAALLLPVLFLGALEIHPAGDAHDFLADSHRTEQEVFSCATGSPLQSTHVHAAVARELPPCPACLLRLQIRGIQLLADVAPLAAPDLLGRLHVGADPVIGRFAIAPRDARGPPVS